MKRRLMSRKKVKSRSGVRSAARIFSGNATQSMAARNKGFFDGGPLNISSNQQMNGTVTSDQRRNLASADNGERRNNSVNDSLLKGGETIGDN